MEEGFTLIFWHWFVLAALLGVLEIMAPGIFFLWLSLAALFTGVTVALFVMSAALQITIFSALSMLMVVVAWKVLKRHPIKSDEPALNDRATQMIGKIGKVEVAIEQGAGRITLGDSTWKATADSAIAVGEAVRILAVNDGVLKVEKI